MSSTQFFSLLQQEVDRVDAAKTAKRHERVIEGFATQVGSAPRAIVNGKKYQVFNSNDYLGLRHHPSLHQAEVTASQKFGTGPGAVRFISGSLAIHRQLEQAIAKFHGRDDAMIFSSAFATNLAVIFCLITGQSADSLVKDRVLVVSDALNHRSIIDGIRLANLPKEQRVVFKHLDMTDLKRVLQESLNQFDRVLIITDGVFSMVGEYQNLKALRQVTAEFDDQYAHGIQLIVDDAHGIAAFGQTGRGTEEITGTQADVLVGTIGKGFGADGGYVVADQVVIDYLRESAATYIYSNSISPGTAGAALAAIELLNSPEGQKLLAQSRQNVSFFKTQAQKAGLEFAADSVHPIQPLLIGDPGKTKQLKEALFEMGIIVTNINYPVVPKGRDEIRIQISATHTQADLEYLIAQIAKVLPTL